MLVIYGHGGNLGSQRVKSRVMHILSDAAALKVQPLCVVNLFQPSCLCYLIIMTICVCVVRNSFFMRYRFRFQLISFNYFIRM